MDWVRGLRIAAYTGLFALPFIGLIVANGFFFPFITGKNFAFRIIVEIVFALWLIIALVQPEFRPKRSVALMLGLAFVVSIGISTLLAENPIKAFWSNFERMEGYITVLHLALYVTVLTGLLRTEELWRRFFNTSIGASVIIAIYGVFQLLGAFTINQGGMRVDGTFGNATYLAVYMLIHAFITLLALMRWSKSWWMRSLYAIALLLQVTMVFYTATRGTILGLVGGLFLAGLIFAFSKGSGTLRNIGIGFIIFVVALSGFFFSIRNTDFVQNNGILSRIASISLAQGATRFQIWSMAFKGFEERPLFGWGQEGFNFVFNKYYYADLYSQEPWFDRAHNVGLDWLIAGGIFGALLYLSLYGVLIYYLWRPGNAFDVAERALLTGLLAGYAFHNVFVFDNLMSYLMFMMVFSYITVRAVGSGGWGQPVPDGVAPVAAPTVAIAALVALYAFNVPGISAATDVIKGLQQQPGGISQNIQYYKDAVNATTHLGAQEVHEQLLQFAIQLRQVQGVDDKTKTEVATYARDEFLNYLATNDKDSRLQVFLGSFLRQFGDYAGAEQHLAAALALSPQKQLVMFELGSVKLAKGDGPGALAVLKKAYEEAPAYDQAVILYSVAAIQTGDQALADSVLTKRYGTTDVANDFLLQAYIQTKNFPRAVKIAEARVKSAPNSLQYTQQLAGVYAAAGMKQEALSAIKRAIEIDPSFKTQGETYMQQILQGTF